MNPDEEENSLANAASQLVQSGERNQNDNQVEGLQISAHQLKLPPFWNSSPEAWFIVAEAQFRASNLTNENRRYTPLLTTLPPEVIHQVRDLIQNPPDETRLYSVFKEKFLQRLTPNEEQRIANLLYHAEIGDRKPSEFYRHLEHLAGQSNEIGRKTIRKLFINRLPKSIGRSLILLENQQISDQIEIADKLWEVENSQIPKFPSINSASSPNQTSPSASQSNVVDLSEIQKLNKEISELKLAIKNITTGDIEEIKRPSRNFSRGRRSYSRSRSKSKEWNSSPSTTKKNLCWYHEKFGDKAIKCYRPCKFFASTPVNNSDDSKN